MESINYRHTKDMGEISGFGGGYENACQDMLDAGVNWLVARKEKADLQGKTYEGIYGIFASDSEDAKQLEDVVVKAAGGDCTGAMHQAVMSRLFYINKNGWDNYCEEVRKRSKDD